MIKYKPVSVSKIAFTLCKSTLALLILLALIFKIKALIIIVFIHLVISAVFGIENGPLIHVYTFLSNIFRKTEGKKEMLDQNAMRFARSLGASLSGICLILLYTIEIAGWILVVPLFILKTLSAFGFCIGKKLYQKIGDHEGECCQ
jgi:hypothetical protein